MVKNYLEELYQELYSEKISLEQKLKNEKIELRDNIKYVKKMKESLDEDFDSFSPKKVNQDKYNEINEMLEKQKIIQGHISTFKEKIDIIEFKIQKLDCVIENYRLNQGYTDIPSKQNENFENDMYFKNDLGDFFSDLSNIYHKLDICSNLINIDPVRCRLELNEIKKSVEHIITLIKNN